MSYFKEILDGLRDGNVVKVYVGIPDIFNGVIEDFQNLHKKVYGGKRFNKVDVIVLMMEIGVNGIEVMMDNMKEYLERKDNGEDVKMRSDCGEVYLVSDQDCD
jgi:hypothetical protein